MSSIVLELQRDCNNHNIPVSVLIQKAYMLARKLGIEELKDWASSEMNGYDRPASVPPYRMIYGTIKALNPIYGYIPVLFTENWVELEQLINNRTVPLPVSEIEDLIRQCEASSNHSLRYGFPSNIQQKLMKITHHDMEISLHVSSTQLKSILDKVRNTILDWTLDLEENHILGEGMTFTDMEKERAAETARVIINNIGSMNNSQLQQGNIDSQQKQKINIDNGLDELKNLLPKIQEFSNELEDENERDELLAELSVIEAQVNSPKPKVRIIAEALNSVRNIAEGTVGSLLASGIIAHTDSVLKAFGLG